MFCSLHANTASRGGGFLFSPAFKTKFYWPVSFVGKVVFRNSGKGGKEGEEVCGVGVALPASARAPVSHPCGTRPKA